MIVGVSWKYTPECISLPYFGTLCLALPAPSTYSLHLRWLTIDYGLSVVGTLCTYYSVLLAVTASNTTSVRFWIQGLLRHEKNIGLDLSYIFRWLAISSTPGPIKGHITLTITPKMDPKVSRSGQGRPYLKLPNVTS